MASAVPSFYRAVNTGSDFIVRNLSPTKEGFYKEAVSFLSGVIRHPVGVPLIQPFLIERDLNVDSSLKRATFGILSYSLVDSAIPDRVMRTVLFPFFSKHANASARTVGETIKAVATVSIACLLNETACDYFDIANIKREKGERLLVKAAYSIPWLALWATSVSIYMRLKYGTNISSRIEKLNETSPAKA